MKPCGTTRFSLAACGRGALLLLLWLTVAWQAYCAGPALSGNSPGNSEAPKTMAAPSSQGRGVDAAELAENSREAGLLTDWHVMRRYGHGGTADFARHFAPERWATNQAAKQAAWAAKAAANKTAEGRSMPTDRHFRDLRYELLFPEGTFVLPPALAGHEGVFYALSQVYLSGGGDWNVYLESGAEAVVFVDGNQVLTRGARQTGTLRETIHAESGFHMVMIKFLPQSAPFRLAILPPNSGSRRKNNTPYLRGGEDLNARLRGQHTTKVAD